VHDRRNENVPEIPDFLSDDFVLTNVLNDISNFETGQISVQNNSQTVAVTNTPTLNTFRIPGIQSIPSPILFFNLNSDFDDPIF
jgi:hypothetical protein